MSLKMKDMPEAERPYEKLKMYGEDKLTNAELLAIIIKTGTKEESALQIAQRILLLIGKMKEIRELSIEDLTKIKGIGEIKAIQLKAICELTKRMEDNTNIEKLRVTSPEKIAKKLICEFQFEKQEIIKTIILNQKLEIIKELNIARGDTSRAQITLKQILAEAVRKQAPYMIVVHNHPSGDPTPSKKDIEFTKKLIESSNLLGIKLLDHLIIGNNKYESILKNSLIKET